MFKVMFVACQAAFVLLYIFGIAGRLSDKVYKGSANFLSRHPVAIIIWVIMSIIGLVGTVILVNIR